MFTAHVERTISAAHANGPEGNRCLRNHGHDWHVVVEISYNDAVVDDSLWGWGPDFGEIKHVIDSYDHQDLNGLIGEWRESRFVRQAPSAENFARQLYRQIQRNTHHEPDYVEVSEGHGNRVTYRR